MKRKVLVAGATGYLGKYITREFKQKGYWVRALGRSNEKLDKLKNDIDEKFIAEITNVKSLNGICDNIDIVFSSIGITKQKDGLTFMDVDYQANKNLLDEAIKTGVKKFIYVSVFGAEKMTELKAIQAKLKFEEELRNSGLDYSVIYPNGFFSDMKEYLLMAQKGRGYVLGNGENRINPIHGADLAVVCAEVVNKEQKQIEVGGPEVLTHNQIMNIAFEIVNKPKKTTHIPIWLSNSILWLTRTFTSEKKYGGLEFFMTVLSKDMVAPNAGSRKLEDYFKENLNIK